MWQNIKKGLKWVADHTGISWVWKKISLGWKWLFSGSGANKANADNASKDQAPNNDTVKPAPGLDKGQGRAAQVQNPAPNNDTVKSAPGLDKGQGGTAQVQNPGQKDEVNPVGNNLSATDPPAGGSAAKAPQVPNPNQARNGTSGQSQGESKVAAPVTPAAEVPAKPTPGNDTQQQAPEVEKLSGKIIVYTDGKNEIELKLNLGKHKNFDTLTKWKNPADSEEFYAFIKLSGKILYITGRYSSRTEVGGNAVAINSVGIPGTKTVYGSNNLEEMKNLLGLNKTTTEVDVEIYKEAKAAEKATAKPEGNVESAPEVKPEMTKESEAGNPANVREPSSTSVDPKVVDNGSPQEDPQNQEDSKGETVTAGSGSLPADPILPVIEESSQPKVSGAATVKSESEVEATETEPKSPVVVVNGETQGSGAAESSKEQPDGGQEHGPVASESPAPAPVDEESSPEAEATNPSNAPPAPTEGESAEGGQKHVDEVSGSQGEDQQEAGQKVESNSEPAASGGAQLTQISREPQQFVFGNKR